MPTVAASTIITNARRLADQEGATTRFPDPEILTYLNTGSAEIWETITSANGFFWGGKGWLTYGTVTQTGSDPTITFGGNPVGDFANIRIKISTGGTLGTPAQFQYSLDGGTTYQTAQNASASAVSLGTTGITVTFVAGTYTLNNVYSVATSPVSLNANQQYYALPSDFYKIHACMVIAAGWPGPVMLSPMERMDNAVFRDTVLLPVGAPVKYDIRSDLQGGNWIGFYPQPNNGTTLRMHYYPNAPTFATTSSTIEVYNFTDEWIAHYAARRMALKDEDLELASLLTSAMGEIEKKIRSVINQGRSSDAKHIQNSTRQRYLRFRRYFRP
jgi:hypothetical protein